MLMSEVIEYKELSKILPQSTPFLMIDRVEEIKRGESLVAIKNISANEWFFNGVGNVSKYFPEVLLIEAASQAALVLYHLSKVGEGESVKYLLTKIDSVFNCLAPIGVQIRLDVVASKMLKERGYMDIKLAIDDIYVGDVTMWYKIIK